MALLVQGNLKINPDGKQVRSVPLAVRGDLSYDERVISAAASLRAIRYYHAAQATLQINQSRIPSRLADGHRMAAVYVDKDRTTLICPGENLTREELDLLDVQGNTAVLANLLPNEPKEASQEWEPSHATLAMLMRLEAISKSDVKCKLLEVSNRIAVIQFAGSISGAVGGVSSDIDLSGKLNFDLANRRITSVAMEIEEKRAIGHAEPGLDVKAKLKIALKPTESARLNTIAIQSLPPRKPEDGELLTFESKLGAFRLLHDRRWRVIASQPHLTVLRMIDRGDLVAQCNVSKLTDLPAGQHLQLEQFQADVQKSLGDSFGQFVQASQSSTDSGYRVLRVVAAGKVSDLPIQWIYYHVATEQGRRVSYVFTLESKYVDQFAAADSEMVDSLELIASGSSTQSPTPAGTSARKPTPGQHHR